MKTLAFLCAAALAARADEVVLKSGGRFAGIVEERGDRVVVRTEHGSMTFDRAQVAVPLISQDFLNSDFIRTVELPALLKGANYGDCRVLCLHVEVPAPRRLAPRRLAPVGEIRKWARP